VTYRDRQSESLLGRRGGVGAVGLLLVAGAWQGASGEQPGLRRIHQRVADLDPLSVSLLQLEPDLRQDVGFQHLYVEEGHPGRFVRVSGAMYAVSPRTDYYQSRDEVYAVVSPGTVFYIGAPPELGEAGDVERGSRGVSEGVGMVVDAGAGARGPVRMAEVVTSAPMAVFASEMEDAGATQPRPTTARPAGATATERAPAVASASDMSDASFRAQRLREIAERLGGW
jgi:hypothetical protein